CCGRDGCGASSARPGAGGRGTGRDASGRGVPVPASGRPGGVCAVCGAVSFCPRAAGGGWPGVSVRPFTFACRCSNGSLGGVGILVATTCRFTTAAAGLTLAGPPAPNTLALTGCA